MLNRALAHIEPDKCRAHVCWGNYPGTHHCDIELRQIFNIVMGVKAKFISIESSNHRHAHEWEILKGFSVPQNKILMPGLIDTTSNTIEHPELVASAPVEFCKFAGTGKGHRVHRLRLCLNRLRRRRCRRHCLAEIKIAG